jgi:hypothetical protein
MAWLAMSAANWASELWTRTPEVAKPSATGEAVVLGPVA